MVQPVQFQIGPLGFGVAGPLGARTFSNQITQKVIHCAMDCGVYFFDTAPSYGGGRAERRLGAAIADMDRNKLFIATKAGLNEQKERDFSPLGIAQSLERSLQRLGLEYVDAFFLHGPGPYELTNALFTVLAELQASGKFRYLGITGRSAELDAALVTKKFDLIMLPMGPNSYEANQKRAKTAKTAGMTVIGIEMISHTRAPWRWSLWPGDLWHMARKIRRGGVRQHGNPMQALRDACLIDEVDIVLTSSTRVAHVNEWRLLLDERPIAS